MHYCLVVQVSTDETESILDILSQPSTVQLRIRHVESGFAGLSIDAQSYVFMTNISVDGPHPIPANCYLLTRINRRPFHLHRSLRHLNRVVRE